MENKIHISYIIKYIYKIFRLILLGIGITYILACLWYLFIVNTNDPDRPNFYSTINNAKETNF